MSSGPSPLCRQSCRATSAHLGQTGDRVAVVAGHHLLVVARALRGGARSPPAAGARSRARSGEVTTIADAAVALLAAVEQAQRLDDPARALVLLERDRLAVEPRLGLVAACGGRRPRRGRSPRWWRRTRACSAAPNIATHDAGVSRPNGAYQPKCAVSVVATPARGPARRAEALPRALVERAVADDHVRDAARRPPCAACMRPCRTPRRRRSGCGEKNVSVARCRAHARPRSRGWCPS